LYKTAPLKNTWGDFGHVEIYNKIEYIWTSEYAVFNKMAYLRKFTSTLVKKTGESSKSASVKTASNEIQKTQFGQRQHTRNQNSQFQNSQHS
jgi:hypothetical protein